MSTENSHLAIQANIQSVTLAMKGDREGWLALYADDAVVKDPVGKSPFDAVGDGHRGKAGGQAVHRDAATGGRASDAPGHHACGIAAESVFGPQPALWAGYHRSHVSRFVMPGLDPGIHDFL